MGRNGVLQKTAEVEDAEMGSMWVSEIQERYRAIFRGRIMETRFHRAMARIYEEAKKEGYTASYFLRMLAEHGGVETARRLINSESPSEGFTRLYMMKRLDLSVEALVSHLKWEPLFTDEERAKAIERLQKYDFNINAGRK